MDVLVGYTGFVGVNLIQYMKRNTIFINSGNTDAFLHKEYDTVYYCGVYAEKWKANKYPEDDTMHINKIIDNLSTIRCNKFVLVSTVDVLDCSVTQNEQTIAPTYSTHTYGVNRRRLEEWCMNQFKECYVFRLPALFGYGLKKNALYDMIQCNNIDKLCSQWKFQWYNVGWLYNDIHQFISEDKSKIVHLITPQITLGCIQKLFFSKHTLPEVGPIVNYDLQSIYYTQKKQEDIFVSMKEYIESVQQDKKQLMVSELAWNNSINAVMTSWLKSRGVSNIEAVPSKLGWNMDIYPYIYSAQSILYNIQIQIFKEQDLFLEILEDKLKLLHSKGTHLIVFGSPSQRIFNGEDINGLFSKIGGLCEKYNIVFCLENNSSLYGCNWMTTARETLEFVKSLNHSHVKVNLDTGSMLMENERLTLANEDIPYIGHVQVSFPRLGAWDKSYEELIEQVIRVLYMYNYTGKISLEMKASEELPCSSIQSFIQFMHRIYI
jgi:hypothetical protein